MNLVILLTSASTKCHSSEVVTQDPNVDDQKSALGRDKLVKDFAMFIDERTRTLQKHLLDVLYEQTNSNGGTAHSEEVTRFRDNPYGAEFSNFFYCRELKLKSWYPQLMQPTRDQKFDLWQALQLRCSYADVDEPQIWGAATDIYSLVSHLRMSERDSI